MLYCCHSILFAGLLNVDDDVYHAMFVVVMYMVFQMYLKQTNNKEHKMC